ncbi:hypothetical protein X798_01557 [Onchocerca flexuosa]|uniref:Uncharacterized protein n=1 Tax=Onchocerca flexuosa TaxID=387005 RepID=A0A238C2S7_9BILA|nr:hypothetical protein X798_01557 [Onchocerca flexuosa]
MNQLSYKKKNSDKNLDVVFRITVLRIYFLKRPDSWKDFTFMNEEVIMLDSNKFFLRRTVIQMVFDIVIGRNDGEERIVNVQSEI